LWLVCDRGDVSICPTDPGFEVNLFVTTDLRTMTRVWMGDLSVRVAIGSGGIELEGPREFRQRFERWLGLSGFAGIEDARRPARDDANTARSERRHAPHRVV
jgi:hypothetical protein